MTTVKKSLYLPFLALAALSIMLTHYFLKNRFNETKAETQELILATTIYPLFDMTRSVAGSNAQVINILPPGSSPHLFEFSPSKIKEMQNVKLIFALGHGLDTWASRISQTIGNIDVVLVDKDVDLRKYPNGAVDPHYWLSMQAAQKMVDNIAHTLAQRDPEHADGYIENAHLYKIKLEKAQERFVVSLKDVKDAAFLTLHDAWFYFARDLHLSLAGSFETAGGEEPTIRYLNDLGKKIHDQRIHVIFTEPQLSLAALKSFAKDHHLTIAELDPIGGSVGRMTYLDLMEYNVLTLKNTLLNTKHE
ncbi:MAG: zinc ABC transporter substrate-binding protein [Myxococcales bacterium]|nr:zinc ABC transporter substrate-binding protein [Myxococcales bacterium]USN49916.1 MAG: zinc ABC transporter substrate-binding protein [Myxococcales bacterium]